MQSAQTLTKSYPNKFFLVTLAFLVVPLSGLAIDIYVPSLPQVSHFFGISKALTQLTITAYMLGFGFMQLFAGGLSDSFGRRLPFLFSMSIFFLTTLLIPFVHTIDQLIILRFIQGSMLAVAVVPLRSVPADLYQGEEYYKISNYMTMAWSIGPIIAPAIGGYLQEYFGWQSNFVFLAIYSLVSLLAVGIFLPDTSNYHHPYNLKHQICRYKKILLCKDYMLAVLTNGLLYSSIILFAVVGPFLIQNILHFSPSQFGHVAFLTGLAWFLGTLTNRFLLKVSFNKRAVTTFTLMLIIASVGLAINYFIVLNIYAIVIPALMLLWLGGSIFPNNFAKSISLFPKISGTANALFGGLVFIFTGISSSVATLLKSSTSIPLFVGYLVLIVICLMIAVTQLKK